VFYILTEAQLQCLEKAKLEKEAHGEIETEHPGVSVRVLNKMTSLGMPIPVKIG